MPLFQYFGWVGSLLLAVLFAANWFVSGPNAHTSGSDVPFDQKINIRIHTDHKWPERVVFDRSSALPQRADAQSGIGAIEPPVVQERQPFDAFAAIPVRPCFRPPCSAGPAAEWDASRAEKSAPSQIRSRMAARKNLTWPNRPHKPPGKN
jgi:hypothetical protein